MQEISLSKRFDFKTIKFLKISNNQKNALDLACGKGEYSIILKKMGWRVISVDKVEISRTKIHQFSGINYYKINLEKNIRSMIKKNPFKKRFSLIIVFNFLNRELLKRLPFLLKKNGFLLYKTFMIGNEKYGKPSNQNYLLRKNELLKLGSNKLKIKSFFQGKKSEKSVIQSAVFQKS